MKKIPVFFSALVLFLSVSFFTGCGGGNQIPPEVCQYGEMVIEVAQTLCDNFPQIPPEVCTWVDIAELNLNALCNSEPGSLVYQ